MLLGVTSQLLMSQASLKFDGINDFIQTTGTPISGSGARTVEAWIKTTKNSLPANQGGNGQSVIVDWGNNITNGRFTFNILFNNAVRLEIQGSGVSGTIPVNDGNWHHVVAVYDPTLTNKVALYVDGVLDVTGNFSGTPNTSSSIKLKIGQRVDGVNHFDGDIDEVRVWNFAKSQNQILDDMDLEYCSTQSGLVAYYKFNEGEIAANNSSITILPDYSGNNYNGTFNNFALNGSNSNYSDGASLSLYTIDYTVQANNQVLTSNQSGATYQWINCDTDTPISGENSQTYTATSPGNYSVKVSLNGCNVVSDCVEVTTLSDENITFEKRISIFPNPATSSINVKLDKTYSFLGVKVFNNLGQKIWSNDFSNVDFISINSILTEGIYFIELRNEFNEVTRVKVIKK